MDADQVLGALQLALAHTFGRPKESRAKEVLEWLRAIGYPERVCQYVSDIVFRVYADEADSRWEAEN